MFRVRPIRWWVFAPALGLGGLAPVTAAIAEPTSERVHVRMDTSAWTHFRGWLAVEVTTRTPECGSTADAPKSTIRFLDILHDGSVGPLRTSGCGGMQGSLILHLRHPASWSVPRFGERGFAVNFADPEFMPDPAWIGSYVRFTVELPIDDLHARERIDLAFLDRDCGSAFGTGDGRFAMLEADPAGSTWRARAFAPAHLSGDTIVLVLPPPPLSAGAPVRPRRVLPRIVRLDVNSAGGLWVEYAVPLPGGPVRVRAFDAAGVERFRHEAVLTSPGVYGVDFPEDRSTPAPPGRYRIVVEIGEHRLEDEYDLRPPDQR
jgi:hypothetical protein